MVVMSMEAYEERMRMLDVYAKLASAEQQVHPDRFSPPKTL